MMARGQSSRPTTTSATFSARQVDGIGSRDGSLTVARLQLPRCWIFHEGYHHGQSKLALMAAGFSSSMPKPARFHGMSEGLRKWRSDLRRRSLTARTTNGKR